MAVFQFAASYQPISFQAFQTSFSRKKRRQLAFFWGLSLLVSVGLGVVSTELSWFSLPVHIWGTDVFLTVYPPLILCTLWVLWFGFWWGFIPAYLSTFILALYTSGMPVGWSALFAFADPLGLAIFALAYRAVPFSYDLRSANSLFFFILLAFVAGILSSSGSFIWTYTNATGIREVFPIWQGWWLGAFLQAVFINGPLLFLLTPAVHRWKAALPLQQRDAVPSRRQLALFAGVSLLGVFFYFFAVRYFSMMDLEIALESVREEPVARGVRAAFESFSATEWVMLVLVGFTVFFGYQVFVYWVKTLGKSARALQQANQRLRSEIEERRRVESELAASNVAKDKFFSIIAHDMRGSLSSFIVFSQLFGEEASRGNIEEIQKLAAILNTSAENVYAFLENLLQWARIQTGAVSYTPSSLKLRGQIEDVVTLLAGNAEQKAIRVVNQVSDTAWVYADANMLRSIVQNLLTNAVKFTPAGGTVTLHARALPGAVEVSVEDTGVGMVTEDVETLFALETKMSRPGTEGEPGSGLGLTLCKEFVELNGGTISVASTPGQGTTVRFTLPDSPASTPAPGRPRRATVRPKPEPA